ncbi:hypothetical protein [Enterococcus sp. 5H]|uniref:hypothetical protein n=1 Tax=Enterococcus sp. 5H TaxID=1229490 RepID=UPI0023021C64|nr:hypothetical protein [Enterococcus sp. 5H]MDA9471959.1 hypothetical protein [Enterococcus sp. 5H]
MKKKFAVLSALLFSVLLFSGTIGYADEVTPNEQPVSFQPYFSSASVEKYILPFETFDFLIPKLPVVSGYHVNYRFNVDVPYPRKENFLVEQFSPNGQCIIAEDVIVGSSSEYYFASTAGAIDYGSNYLVARVTNLSPQSINYRLVYNYKLSKDPTDFVGL